MHTHPTLFRVLDEKLSAFAARVWREPNRELRRRVRHAWYEWRIRRSGLFDAQWYVRTFPEVLASGLDPLRHFVRRGAAEGLDPNPWFDTSWYSERNRRAATRGRNPLVHYLRHADRDPHPEFSTRAYLESFPGAARSGATPLRHFLAHGARELEEKLAEARRVIATGVMNAAWYGGTRLERPLGGERGAGVGEFLAMQVDRADTRELERFVDSRTTPARPRELDARFLARTLAPAADFEARLASTRPAERAGSHPGALTFTVVTPFYSHFQHLAECARSVAELAARSAALEWVVVNDDPSFDEATLWGAVPEALRKSTRVLFDGRRRGIVARLNEGVLAARNEWILFVDCDDLVAPEATEVLGRYIERFPRCRYLSSAVVDIGEEGQVLRYRRRTTGPAQLLGEGMTAGHLKAIRRDALEEYGLFDPSFDGCQDYELALRIATSEPLLYVPEYLYSYRWHRRSQSVAQAARQARTDDAIVRRYALRLLARPERRGEAAPVERGVAVVRTQGLRNELLLEALRSLRIQTDPIAAVLVVHGGPDALRTVREVTAGLEGVEVLHAPETDRLRGHPLNVALAHIHASPAPWGFVCFLDDDDVLYPTFASAMIAALRSTGADLVHAASNKRVLGGPAQSAYVPLPAPTLLVQNSIPINAYAVRAEALRTARLEFDEELDYMEDWDFLVRALGSGMRFHPLDDVLSEFRLTGDGNTPTKTHPHLWAAALRRIRPRVDHAAEALGRDRLLAELLEFPAHLLERLDEDARRLVFAARALVDERCPAAADRGRPREIAS